MGKRRPAKGESAQATEQQPDGVIVHEATVTYQGPIPPASELEKYKKVSPDLVDRIMSMAEREQSHRTNTQRLGQFFAFSIMVIALIVAGSFGYWGSASVGGWLAGIIVASLVGLLYVRQRHSRVPIEFNPTESD